jgi:hypothetical protein
MRRSGRLPGNRQHAITAGTLTPSAKLRFIVKSLPTAWTATHSYSSIGPIPHSHLPSLQSSRIPTARSCPLLAGRRLIGRAHVLVRKPHTRRWQRLSWAVERRQDVQPPAILAQEVVLIRTTTPDGAVNARVGVRHRRDAEKPETITEATATTTAPITD